MSRPDLAHIEACVIAEALAEGLAATWLRRAEAFEAAKPKADDFLGRTTRSELRRRWYELDKIAQACRARAAVCEPSEFVAELGVVLGEVAS